MSFFGFALKLMSDYLSEIVFVFIKKKKKALWWTYTLAV